jgi:hypothetical protein
LQKSVAQEGEKQTLLLQIKSKNYPYLFLQRLLTAWSRSWEVSRLLDGQAVNSVSYGVYCQENSKKMKTQQQQSKDKKKIKREKL